MNIDQEPAAKKTAKPQCSPAAAARGQLLAVIQRDRDVTVRCAALEGLCESAAAFEVSCPAQWRISMLFILRST